jgi:hypothetical protein
LIVFIGEAPDLMLRSCVPGDRALLVRVTLRSAAEILMKRYDAYNAGNHHKIPVIILTEYHYPI